MADPYAGIQYYPQIIPGGTLVGRLAQTPGATEAIPLAILQKILAPGQSDTTTELLLAFPSTVTVADGTTILTTGRTVPGDSGGGQFRYNAEDTTSLDNGGTIRVDLANRRWYFIKGTVTPELFGAAGNAIATDTASITNGQHRITDTAAAFTSADVGKTYGVMGAGAAGVTLITTIAAFVDSTHVDLTATASTSVTNVHAVYGKDDSTALTNFFTERTGKDFALSDAATGYLSSTKLSAQSYLGVMKKIPIYFLIGNTTDNCFTVAPVVPLVNSQATSRYTYDKLWLDCMATGQDAFFMKDGSPNLMGLIVRNSYRDAVYLQPDGTGTPITAIENLTGIDWLLENCGRHAIHLYLKCKNDTSVQTYINESMILACEVRLLGRRFGTGGAGTNTAANLVRITYDDCVVNLTENKVSTFLLTGNFDAGQASSLGGAAVGDVIYHNAINGTTNRRVEHFDFKPGGIESSDGTLISGSKIVTGSNIATGDWIECDLEQGVPFQWGLSGVDNAILSSAADGNTFLANNPTQGAQTYKAFVKRPTDLRSLVSADTYPNGGIIDPRFKNSMTPWIMAAPLVASGTVNFDIPINSLSSGAFDYFQWPLTVKVVNSPTWDTPAKVCYGNYTVFCLWDQDTPGASVGHILEASQAGSDLTSSFTPSSGVAFSIQSSSGSLHDILRVTVTGGANVGSAGQSTDCAVYAGRWGAGVSELQRVLKGNPGGVEMSFKQ